MSDRKGVVICGDGGVLVDVVGCVCIVVGVVVAVADFAGFAVVTGIVSSGVFIFGLDGDGLDGVGLVGVSLVGVSLVGV